MDGSPRGAAPTGCASPTTRRPGGLAARRHGPARGTGAPLLLVHGLTDDGGCWPDALARWGERAVWTVDLPSHGRSPRLTPAALGDPAFLATGRSGLDGDDDLQVELVARAGRAVPALLVTGDRPGAIWTSEQVARLAQTGPQVTVAVVPGGDHTVRRVAPSGYHAVVDPFLAEVGA